MQVKAWTYGDFKIKSNLYTTFIEHSPGNWGLALTDGAGKSKPFYAVGDGVNSVFLGTDAKDGMRVVPYWKAETGWPYVNADFTGALLQVQFVRIPKT